MTANRSPSTVRSPSQLRSLSRLRFPSVSKRGPLGDRGAAAAEFAIVLPALVLVLVLGVGALSSAGLLVRLQDSAADAARLLGRAESPDAAAAAVSAATGEASMSVDRPGGLVCVTVTARSRFAFLPPLVARSCALDGGR